MSRVQRSVLTLLLLGSTQIAFAANNPFEPSSRPAQGTASAVGPAPAVPGALPGVVGPTTFGPNGLPVPGMPGAAVPTPKPVDLDAVPVTKLMGVRIGTVNGKSVYRYETKYFFDKTGKELSKADREAALQAHGLPADSQAGGSVSGSPVPPPPGAPAPAPHQPKTN